MHAGEQAGEQAGEREITTQVSLTRPDGRLDPAAVGWTRRPLHDTSGIGRGRYGRGRNKRWEYWALTTPTHVVALTVSDIDYAAVLEVFVLDRATGASFGHDAIGLLGRGAELPPTLGGAVRARTKSFRIDIDEVADGTRLQCISPRLELDVVAHRPAGHECLGVVVPWSERLFQYTVKDVGRPVTGYLVVDGAPVAVPDGASWATLDHGRGRWPYVIEWNWGAGAGRTQGRTLGLQVGGRWTDGTGTTENAIVVDGRLSKIAAELTWDYDSSDWLAPWQVYGDGVRLRFTPEHLRTAGTDLKLVSSRTHQAFGTWSGEVRDAAGTWVPVADLYGWAEEVRQRW
ncbi:DUF2804 domain-containing protein [Nocardioides sp. zg-ZUI104]|uniref:DUF2804 domain-containing protein n=1 Tax=Nocardioides faecalis TaxID=2803858 RepID=UPI001BD06413|nr:DUF2804 domain-containing protein [Nocardioides faecalis]MBS4753124.1 DUF2804 domain-containing protein [Nocardioides faecalis]